MEQKSEANKRNPQLAILPPSHRICPDPSFFNTFPCAPLSSFLFLLGKPFFFFNKLVLNRELCPSSGKFSLPSWGITITVVGRPYISFFPFEQNPYQETARIFEDLRRRTRKTNTPHLQRKPTCRYIHIHTPRATPLSLSVYSLHTYIYYIPEQER